MSSTATISPVCDEETHTAQIVDTMIQKASRIAALPGVTTRIIQFCENPDAAIEELNKIIDPVLGVRLLKLVNSAYYGLPAQVSSIKRAIVMLGLNAVKNMAIAASLVKLVRGGRMGSDFSGNDLQIHSIAVATCARMLAQQSQVVSPDEAFLAGLIHDIGITVEVQLCGPQFAEVIRDLGADETLTFRAAEKQVFGATHEDLGAGLCAGWNFPRSLRLSTGFHHRPWEVAAEDRRLPVHVHLADILTAQLGMGYTRTVESREIDPLLCSAVNLSEAAIAKVVEHLPDAVQESKRMLCDDN